MFIKLTNRFGNNLREGEEVFINFDKVVSFRASHNGSYLKLESDRMREFICCESVEEILATLAGGLNAPR